MIISHRVAGQGQAATCRQSQATLIWLPAAISRRRRATFVAREPLKVPQVLARGNLGFLQFGAPEPLPLHPPMDGGWQPFT
jgi:hypothetical protein